MVIVATNYDDMKKILSFFICALVFISCSKEEEYIIEYPTTFTPSEIHGQKIRVFTKKGEIKDSKTTLKIIERIKNHLTELENYNIADAFSATYLSPTSLEIYNEYYTLPTLFNLYETPSITYWEDKIIRKGSVGVYDYYSNHFKYKPLYYKDLGFNYLINSNTFELQECYYVKKNGNTLIMPFLDFYHIGYKGYNQYKNARQRINNIFISESYNNLGEKDTLVVQEFNLELHIKD